METAPKTVYLVIKEAGRGSSERHEEWRDIGSRAIMDSCTLQPD